jgi:hypothetical protein
MTSHVEQTAVVPASTNRPILQRKCACGGNASAGGECAECRKKKLQRKATGRGQEEAPPIVHEVLQSPGEKLETGVRSVMESSFSSDFRHVRIHTDPIAGKSADAVQAQAYTVGRNIVFAPGLYRPDLECGRKLLAHELAHTLQQGLSPAIPTAIPVARGDDPLEAAAENMSRPSGAHSKEALGSENTGVQLQKAGFGDVRIAEGLAEERAREEVARAKAGKEKGQGPANMAGRILTDADKSIILNSVKGSAEPDRVTPGIRNGKFVLHDTAGAVGSSWIDDRAKKERRSSGEGAAAYAPKSSDAVIAHTKFFGPRRAAATQYERGEDVMKKADREDAYRAVWAATKPSSRESILDAVISTQGSPAKEAADEKANAIKGLENSKERVTTAAAWAAEDICSLMSSTGAAALVPAKGDEPKLEKACGDIKELTDKRRSRVGSAVNVEIVQNKGGGCSPTSTEVLPAYTATQYANVTQLYLRAAMEASFFPEVTTHKLVDRGVGDHCDPRCFNLGKLYEMIATTLKHPTGTTYGITETYGTDTNSNVWWQEKVCGSAAPK